MKLINFRDEKNYQLCSQDWVYSFEDKLFGDVDGRTGFLLVVAAALNVIVIVVVVVVGRVLVLLFNLQTLFLGGAVVGFPKNTSCQ